MKLTTYTAYLVYHTRKKRVRILARNGAEAIQQTKDNHKDWSISMFWMDWPQPTAPSR